MPRAIHMMSSQLSSHKHAVSGRERAREGESHNNRTGHMRSAATESSGALQVLTIALPPASVPRASS